ncbi:MAG TPA: hypothetical protein VHS31_05600 [Tepidisphaeraceae bacterium]|nr:hypothetical protein [Tepidisphaeraceae bacterium]
MLLIIALRARAQMVWVPVTGKADLYPSEQAAVDSMVDSFISTLTASPEFHEVGTAIQIEAREPGDFGMPPQTSGGSYSEPNLSGEVSPQITEAATHLAIQRARERIQLQLPRANISVSENPAPVSRVTKSTRVNVGPGPNVSITQSEIIPINVTFGIALGDVEQFESSTASGYRGRIRGELNHGGIKNPFEARFIDKPWVNDWATFAGTQLPGAWVTGRSTEPSVSESQAISSAYQNAAKQLAGRVMASFNGSASRLSPQALINQIANQLRSRGTADRFVQRIDRPPHGALWRAAVLIPANDESLSHLAPSVAVSQQQPNTSSRQFGSVLALALVILLLYLFLNVVTKGYFTWQLRVGALAVVLIAVFMFMVAVFFAHVRITPAPMITTDHVQLNQWQN